MSMTLKNFRKIFGEELKGKKIILCEHLRTKSIDNVDINLFIGDNTRLLLCPVCQKIMVGTSLEFAARLITDVRQLHSRIEYKKWLEEAGKDGIS